MDILIAELFTRGTLGTILALILLIVVIFIVPHLKNYAELQKKLSDAETEKRVEKRNGEISDINRKIDEMMSWRDIHLQEHENAIAEAKKLNTKLFDKIEELRQDLTSLKVDVKIIGTKLEERFNHNNRGH